MAIRIPCSIRGVWIAWPAPALSVLAYLRWPLAEDPALHFAGVHQALTSGRGLDEVWNFRGFGYNLYLAGLYEIATQFCSFFDAYRFDRIVRGLHLLVLLCGAWVFATGYARFLQLPRKDVMQVFAVVVFAVTATWPTVPLHAEDVTVVCLLYALGCALRPGRHSLVLAVVLAALLPYLKGITVLFVAPIALATLRDRPLRDLSVFAGLWLGAFLAVTLSLWVWAPLQLTDLLETVYYQGASGLLRRFGGLLRITKQFAFNPTLLSGLLALGLTVPGLLAERRRDVLALLAALWLVPFICLVGQGAYYTYHFSTVALASAASLGAFLGFGLRGSAFRPAAFVALMSLAFCVWFGSNAAPREKNVERAWRGVRENIERFAEVERLVGSQGANPLSTVLLASYGTSARYLNVRSACRHFFPVPLERGHLVEPRLRVSLHGFREVSRCFAQYSGEYVLLEPDWLSEAEARRAGALRGYREVWRFEAGRRDYQLFRREPLKPRDAPASRSSGGAGGLAAF